MVKSRIVGEFMKGLQRIEETKDPKELVSLFYDDAALHNLTRPVARAEHAVSPKAFWGQYLSAFEYISSHFTHVIEDENVAVLEWHSKGQLAMGLPIEYCGVSILEHDGKKIKTFRTYYDSAAFLPHTTTQAKSYSETTGLPDINTEISS